MKRIEFFRHGIEEGDIERVCRVLRSIFLTTGKEVGEFEQRFSRYADKRYTVGNMDNIHAALLIGQLWRIETLWKRRDALWKVYEEALQAVKGAEMLRTVPGSKHARHLFTILVDPDKRKSLLWFFQEKGIGVAVNYRPIHLLRHYRETFGYREGDYPVAEEIGKRTISLLLYPKLRDEDVFTVVRTLKGILGS